MRGPDPPPPPPPTAPGGATEGGGHPAAPAGEALVSGAGGGPQIWGRGGTWGSTMGGLGGAHGPIYYWGRVWGGLGTPRMYWGGYKGVVMAPYIPGGVCGAQGPQECIGGGMGGAQGPQKRIGGESVVTPYISGGGLLRGGQFLGPPWVAWGGGWVPTLARIWDSLEGGGGGYLGSGGVRTDCAPTPPSHSPPLGGVAQRCCRGARR